MNIFVHRASECLTDHESHGDGLICFSLLNGLAERGHQIYAYANTAPIRECSSNLHVKTARHRVPANSLAPWEHAWRAERWRQELERTTKFDLVWRMHPYGGACPTPPRTFGKPLVVGPLFYSWPEQPALKLTTGQPRFGLSLQSLIGPSAERGWQRTLQDAALIICATEPQTTSVQAQFPTATVLTLPVIVEPEHKGEARLPRPDGQSTTLLFVANLVSSKNPRIFCETIQHLCAAGVNVRGVVLGDGPERVSLEAWSAEAGMKSAIAFKGKVPNAEVYRELAWADFLVSASLGEPYGRGIAEAMAVGTPAICHRSGGPADFIDAGQDGLLVEDLTATAYADRVRRALAMPGTWKRLSAGALTKARQWRSKVVLDRLESSLQRVVTEGSSKCR